MNRLVVLASESALVLHSASELASESVSGSVLGSAIWYLVGHLEAALVLPVD